jgi:hypothetical protein
MKFNSFLEADWYFTSNGPFEFDMSAVGFWNWVVKYGVKWTNQ